MAEHGGVSLPQRNWKSPLFVFFQDARRVFKRDELGLEILGIAIPAALALAADPIASLIDTAFIGHLGPVEIAAVGVSIAIFNQASKVTIFPLVSITTSFVAEEDTINKLKSQGATLNDSEKGSAKHNNETKEAAMPQDATLEDMEKGSTTKGEASDQSVPEDGSTKHNNETKEAMPQYPTLEDMEKGSAEKSDTSDQSMSEDGNRAIACNSSTVDSSQNKKTVKRERRHIPSASTALFMGAVLGLLQTMFLILLAKPLLSFMGVKSGSPMLSPAKKYLTLRSLGAPAVLLSLAMQGIFRGFKDTKTPLYATVAGDLTNIILDPIFIFVLRLGVSGAAIAHVLSQYLMCAILLYKLIKQVNLLAPSMKDLQFSRFLKNGFLLLARVIAVTFCVTLAASMAARLGSTPMAAFQVCLQVWMTSSLLADGLAVAGQAILACAFAEKDYKKATAAAARVLQMGFALGLGLAVIVGLGLQFGSGIFSKDHNVINLISIGVPFVAATQPINSLAFVFDGVNFGASDFAYPAYSMVVVSIVSIGSLFFLSKSNGFVGIWLALTIYMALRTFAGVWRMGTGTGPWRFLKT